MLTLALHAAGFATVMLMLVLLVVVGSTASMPTLRTQRHQRYSYCVGKWFPTNSK